MCNNPRVSVIMPTFNRANELPRSIKSVLSQTYQNFELIVIDDGSTDHTENVVNSFEDDRLRYERLTENVGGAEARNVGIRLAKGDVVAFQDSDDEWTCTKLEKALKALQPDSVGAVFSSYIQLWHSGCRLLPLNQDNFDEDDIYTSLLWQNYVGTPTLVVKKKWLDAVEGFDRFMPRYQDWDLALNLSKVTTIKYLKEPTLIAYVTKVSITKNINAHRVAIEKIYHKHLDNISKDRTLKALWLHQLGDSRMKAGATHGRRFLFNAFCMNPTSFKYFIKFLFAILGNPRIYTRIVEFSGRANE